MAAAAAGEFTVSYQTPALLRRAVEIDRTYGALDLGLVDGAVMAVAEQERLPILTFDFAHFRATRPERGSWHLVVDERRYGEATS